MRRSVISISKVVELSPDYPILVLIQSESGIIKTVQSRINFNMISETLQFKSRCPNSNRKRRDLPT